MEKMSSYISGEFDVVEIDRCVFKEIFFTENDTEADKWYKAKLQFITIDEKGKEKKNNVYYLVQAGSFEGARKNIDEAMNGTMADYVINTVKETTIMDVFEY